MAGNAGVILTKMVEIEEAFKRLQNANEVSCKHLLGLAFLIM
jgi:hypothetical protein